MDGIAAPAGRAIDPSDPALAGSVPILVGRTREQAVLREELAAAIGGRGRLVLVGGEAGIGKTTLARDLVRARGTRLPRPGWVLLRPHQHPALRSVARPVRGMPARSEPTLASRRLRRWPLGGSPTRRRSLPMCADFLPTLAGNGRPSSCSRTCIGRTPPASISCARSDRTCANGRSCSWRPTGRMN